MSGDFRGGMYDLPRYTSQHQAVLNERWPPDPGNRRRMPRHDLDGIPVRVRVVWERDGEEWIDGVARRWDAEHVYVECLDERRLSGNGVWVAPSDVQRR